MGSSCCCSSRSGGGGRKLGAVAVTGVVLYVAAHAHPGHKPGTAASPTAAVVADAAGRRPTHDRPAHAAEAAAAIAYARRQLGKPYLWGGRGPGAFDCSGLTLMAWKAAGVHIPLTSQTQWKYLHHISGSHLRPGDLIFYAGSDGTQSDPGHVVMYIGDGNIIQAYARGYPVEITPLNAVAAGPLTGYARPGGG